jgi:hypothetical protein|tara:strand:- start:220 stop:585 length:366 start_codon:yes stop_codon:yes gene_type:complete
MIKMGLIDIAKQYISTYMPPEGSRPYVDAATEGGADGLAITAIAELAEANNGREGTASDIRAFGVVVSGVKSLLSVSLEGLLKGDDFNARESIIRESTKFGATVGVIYAPKLVQKINQLVK